MDKRAKDVIGKKQDNAERRTKESERLVERQRKDETGQHDPGNPDTFHSKR